MSESEGAVVWDRHCRTMRRRLVAMSIAVASCAGSPFAAAQTTLVEDLLTSATGCTGACGAGRSVGGSADFTSAGWVPHGPDDRVVYALGEVAVAGSVEFTIAGFAPYSQYQCGAGDQYVEFIAISESDTCDHWATDQAYIMVLYAPGRDVDCSPLPEAPNLASSMRGALDLDCEWQECFPEIYTDPATPTDHRFRVEWDVAGARLYSAEGASATPGLVDAITFDSYPNECSCECEQPLMSHVCIGRSHSSVGHFDGPAFSNVVITKSADYVPSDCCSAGGGPGQGGGGTAGHAAGGSSMGGNGGEASPGGAAVGGGAAPAAAGDSAESGGCGCRSAPRGTSVAGAAIALLGAACSFAWRARPRRPKRGCRNASPSGVAPARGPSGR